ncbi:single insulin-like growth factor-binding domain protein-2 [Macrobrachium rosenbergii]|uniref:single insulin-like growth factor-binding domain protein-2 n=1 Tax=Macrobrachium rosenbergii TaxID=79674 RepID=UPI0034D699B0
MATLATLLLSAVLLSLTSGSLAVNCACDHAKCAVLDEGDCPVGIAHDLCGCCAVCAGALGEECGGPWGIYGECGTGLECHQESCPPDTSDADCYLYYLTEPGKCIEKRRRSVLDFFRGADQKGLEAIRDRRRLRLLHELENMKKK